MSGQHSKLESGLQLLARLSKKKFIENLYKNMFTEGHKPNDIIEIVGDNGSGKSALICDIIAEAILPESYNGAETGVLFVNTDGNTCYNTLFQTLFAKVRDKFTNNDDAHFADEVVHSALGRLHILEVDNPLSFYVTLQNLESIMANHGYISLLIIDTLTAYYWSEQNMKLVKMNSYVQNILKLIQKVIKEFQIVVIYTRPLYFNANMEDNQDILSYQINLKIQSSKYELIYEATCFRNETKYKRYFKFCNDRGRLILHKINNQ